MSDFTSKYHIFFYLYFTFCLIYLYVNSSYSLTRLDIDDHAKYACWAIGMTLLFPLSICYLASRLYKLLINKLQRKK